MNFYKEFCKELKISPANNEIQLKEYSLLTNTYTPGVYPIFKEDTKGNVDILVYTIDRQVILLDNLKAKPNTDTIANNRMRYMSIKRLAEPRTYTDDSGDEKFIKYEFPKGSGSFPFFPPLLLSYYEKQESIDTLILTEGYKKAWYAALFGLPVVGLSSISHYKDKDTKAMYEDVIKLIQKCSVKNVIMLYDGDCFNISSKSLDQGKDLYTRPHLFYSSCLNVRELLKDYPVDVYFASVNSATVDGNPKGLDDIFMAKENKEPELIEDLLSLSKPSVFFTKVNITTQVNKLAKLFAFNAQDFYRQHADTIKTRAFIFRGTKYEFDESKQELKVIIPAEAKEYFRVGNDYYKKVGIPNKYHQIEKQYHRRNASIIAMDHGKKIFEHIPKYEAFCNVPSHTDYTQVINNCYNLYAPFEYQADKEDTECPTSLDFVRHIFGEQYELGLDYIQILYQMPTQILPVLCLVSKENSTGKSTFVKWIKTIFGQNATIIGNDQLNNNFNSSWGHKLVIACEESFIEKQATIEKIKALATADKVQMEMKGRDAVEIDFFGKFILCSNNEERFIIASKDDIRYWVHKVPRIEKIKPRLNHELLSEIPAFLNFLNSRKMHTECESRMWFNPELLKTEALLRLQEASKPREERRLVDKIKELFIDTGNKVIYMPISHIMDILLHCKDEKDKYIRDILDNNLKLDRIKNHRGEYVSDWISIPVHDVDGNIIYIRKKCRPYVFYREKFLTDEDLLKHGIKD